MQWSEISDQQIHSFVLAKAQQVGLSQQAHIDQYACIREPLKITVSKSGAVSVYLWYHLQKKRSAAQMKEHLSMIALNKEQKTYYLQQMLPLLWKGNEGEVSELLIGFKARNSLKAR